MYKVLQFLVDVFQERMLRRAITNTNEVLTYVTAVTKINSDCVTARLAVLVRDLPLTFPVKIQKNKKDELVKQN